MGRKAVIGVLPLYDENMESIWMLPAYFDAIINSGAIPVMLPFNINKSDIDCIDEMFDGYLFTGGNDINPELYGEKDNGKCGIIIKARDELEKLVFQKAYSEDKPIFGICRGLQIINILLGGSLYQDLSTEKPSKLLHRMTKPYDAEAHSVNIEKDSSLYSLLNVEKIGVNSCHHQAIKVLAPSLKSMAKADDGLIEAVEDKTRNFLWAVQWHPEFSYKVNDSSRKIIREFVNACERYNKI